MFIKKIKIKNYRNFGDPPFKMELKPFTVIIGENNIGKTNLLNALGLIFSQEIMIFRKRVLEIDDINYATIESFKEKIKRFDLNAEEIDFPIVNVEVTLAGMDDNQEAIVGDWYCSQDLDEAKITYQFAPAASYDGVGWIEKQRKIIEQWQEDGKPEPYFIDMPIRLAQVSLSHSQHSDEPICHYITYRIVASCRR